MRRIVPLILIAAALAALLLPSLAPPAFADYEAGVKAYSERDYARAQEEFLAPADQGDARAQYALGMLYYQGKGVEKDDAAALEWFRKAEANGHAKAAEMIARLARQPEARTPSPASSPDATPPSAMAPAAASNAAPPTASPDSASTATANQEIARPAPAQDTPASATAPETADRFGPPLPEALLQPGRAPDARLPQAMLAALEARHGGGCRWFSELQRQKDDQGEYQYSFQGAPYTGTAYAKDKQGRLTRVSEYADGYREGPDLIYSTDDKTKATYLKCAYSYKANRKDGTQREYFPDGAEECVREYRDGLAEGDLFRWYADGTPKVWETFRLGKPDGFRMGFFPSGAKRFYIEHKAGKKDGVERFFFENGLLEISQDHREGRCVTPYRVYDSAGKLLEEHSCVN